MQQTKLEIELNPLIPHSMLITIMVTTYPTQTRMELELVLLILLFLLITVTLLTHPSYSVQNPDIRGFVIE